MKDKLCIYHHNCMDGTGAAWVVRYAFGEDNVEFYPGRYGEEPPLEEAEGRDVLLVDFSYKRPAMERLAAVANRVHVIDHHASAERELEGLAAGYDNVKVDFDMDCSGARLAWRVLVSPAATPPYALQLIEDRDLWRFDLPETESFHAVASSLPKSWHAMDWYMAMRPDSPEFKSLINEGDAIVRAEAQAVNALIQSTQHRATIAGYDVPVANIPFTLASKAGNILSGGEPFAACFWTDKDGQVIYSLRSREDGADVSRIAEQFGGGGHPRAAGFKVDPRTIEHREVPRG